MWQGTNGELEKIIKRMRGREGIWEIKKRNVSQTR